MMLNVFGKQTFIQAYDTQSSVYVLINRKGFDRGDFSINQLEEEITRLYEGDYSLAIDK